MARPAKIVALGIAVVVCGLFAWNYLALQRSASQTIAGDPRNAGIRIFAHYEWFANPRVLVFDLREVSDGNSPLDVSRTLLQFADRVQTKQFDSVVLSYKGTPKFALKGDYFQQLGSEYDFQNPVYTLRTLPGNVYELDGAPAFGTWTGGLLGVVGKQMEDLNEFHKRWYLADLADGS